MDWYYTAEGQKKGPVTEEEFQWLVKDCVVTQQTLVWSLGMDTWKPYGEVPPVAVEDLPPRPLDSDLVDGLTCAGCRGGFSPGELITLAGGRYCGACKPLAIQRLKEGVASNHNAEAMRHEYIKHEKSVRTATSLLFLAGGGGVFVGIGRIILAATIFRGAGAVSGPVIFVFAICQLWVATGLRRLNGQSRTPAIIVSSLGLLGFPANTLFSIYVLVVMLSEKTKTILSDEYRMAIEQTPHIKCRTSIIIWIVVVVFVLVAASALFVFYDRRVRHGH